MNVSYRFVMKRMQTKYITTAATILLLNQPYPESMNQNGED
jgi:hypothetical protein